MEKRYKIGLNNKFANGARPHKLVLGVRSIQIRYFEKNLVLHIVVF